MRSSLCTKERQRSDLDTRVTDGVSRDALLCRLEAFLTGSLRDDAVYEYDPPPPLIPLKLPLVDPAARTVDNNDDNSVEGL